MARGGERDNVPERPAGVLTDGGPRYLLRQPSVCGRRDKACGYQYSHRGAQVMSFGRIAQMGTHSAIQLSRTDTSRTEVIGE